MGATGRANTITMRSKDRNTMASKGRILFAFEDMKRSIGEGETGIMFRLGMLAIIAGGFVLVAAAYELAGYGQPFTELIKFVNQIRFRL